eukprot:664005-Rhodomonas_salina.1
MAVADTGAWRSRYRRNSVADTEVWRSGYRSSSVADTGADTCCCSEPRSRQRRTTLVRAVPCNLKTIVTSHNAGTGHCVASPQRAASAIRAGTTRDLSTGQRPHSEIKFQKPYECRSIPYAFSGPSLVRTGHATGTGHRQAGYAEAVAAYAAAVPGIG